MKPIHVGCTDSARSCEARDGDLQGRPTRAPACQANVQKAELRVKAGQLVLGWAVAPQKSRSSQHVDVSVPLAPGARMGPGRNGGTQRNGRPRSRGASSGRKSTAGPVQSSADQHRHTHQRSVWDFGFHFCREWSAVASNRGRTGVFRRNSTEPYEGRCLSSRTSLSRRDRVLGRSAALRLRHGRRFSRLLANGGAARG